MTENCPESGLGRLIEIMATLRSPGGCPWDAEQTTNSLKPYLIEECYEVLAAVDGGDPEEIRDELGDLLLQVIFHARIFEEQNLFDIEDVANAIADKLVRRHPHVFDQPQGKKEHDLDLQWDRIKTRERAAKGQTDSILATLQAHLPGLLRAGKICDKTSRYRLPPPHLATRLKKTLAAVQARLVAIEESEEREKAYGDLFFHLVRIDRQLNLDAEDALRRSCSRHTERLQELERSLADDGLSLAEMDLETLATYGKKIDQDLEK